MATTLADEPPPTGSAEFLPDSGGVWFVPDPAKIHVRQWGHEWVAFHEISGETHLLGPLAVSLYQRIRGGESAGASVVDGALEALGCPGDPELEALARQTLKHLGDIGLARFRAR